MAKLIEELSEGVSHRWWGICRLTRSRSEIVHTSPRLGDVKHSLAAVEKIHAAGFVPNSGFARGFEETILYFKDFKVTAQKTF